jgi:hypothetical protein
VYCGSFGTARRRLGRRALDRGAPLGSVARRRLAVSVLDLSLLVLLRLLPTLRSTVLEPDLTTQRPRSTSVLFVFIGPMCHNRQPPTRGHNDAVSGPHCVRRVYKNCYGSIYLRIMSIQKRGSSIHGDEGSLIICGVFFDLVQKFAYSLT